MEVNPLRYIRQFVVFIMLLVVCGFLLYSSYVDIESKTIVQVNNEQMVHADQAAAGIESFFTSYNDSLSFLAGNDHIIMLDPDGRELMRDFFTSHNSEISSITRVDENGIITYTFPVETSTGTDISSQSHVQQELSTHSVVISDVFTSVQGFRTIAFHMPVFNNGRFKGSIAVLIPFDILAKENLGSIRIIDSGYAWTISRKGVVLYSPYPDQIGKSVSLVFNTSPSVITMAQEAMNGSRGITSYIVNGDPVRHVPSQKFQAVYLPVTIGTTSWSIIVSTPENEILGTIEGFRNNLAIIFAILIISLFFFTFYLARARGIIREEDIRSKAEEVLRESEEFNRSLVENLPDMIAIYDSGGIIRFANQAGLKLLDYPLSEVRGKQILSFVADYQRSDIEKKMQSRLSGERLAPYEVDIRTGSGEIVTAILQAVPITYRKEPVMLVLMTNITDRKREERALHENEQRLDSIYNTVGDTIFQLTVEPGGQYRFTSVNSAFSRTTGLAPEQVIGKTVGEIIPEPALSLVREKYRQAIRQKSIVRWEETSSYPSGQLTGEVSIAPIFDKTGNCTHLIGSVHDISDRKQAEQKLLEAHRDLEKKVAERTSQLSDANIRLQELDRLKSMFIASMSHELRTPLNSIIGFTGILMKGMAGEINPEQKKQLGMVQESARHLLALINDVIDISKIEAGMIEAGVSTFTLADVMLEVSHTFSQSAEERGLILNIEIPGPIAITSDERRIKQIIMNLVSNAIKFSDMGRIDLTVNQIGEVVEVRVRDTGIGIGKDDLERLFRAFVRVNVPGRLTEGTGLGLYLSKKIARFLGGDIMAESEPGKGSVFTFSFPVTYEKKEDI
jgi:PAS domain S-box-containing protein